MIRTMFFVLVWGVLAGAPCFAAEKKASSGREAIADRTKSPYMGAMVIDAFSGKTLFEDNADEHGYPASVLKLMDLYIILERVQKGQLKLDEMVTVNAEAAKTGGTQVYLKEKETFSVDDLLYALMIQSANDAAVALADHIAGSKDGFIELMNAKAKELGMKNTTFHSVHGLPPAAGQEVDVTTPRDLATLARALILQHPESLKYTATKTRTFRPDKDEKTGKMNLINHNHLLGSLAGCDGMKTGYIKAGGYCNVITASRNGQRVITVVMGSPELFGKVRDQKAAELTNKGFAALSATK